MKFQKVIRIVCLLLAALVLVGAVVRPLEVQAAVIAATAGVVGIAVETAIPWILSALSVAWLTTTLQDIIVSRSIEELQDDIIVLDDIDCIPAYDYGSQYYVESDIVSKVANLAADVKTNNVTSSSGMYEYVHTFSCTDNFGLNKWVIWCNEVPEEFFSDSEIGLKIPMPCVVSFSSPLENYTKDFSDEEAAFWNYYQVSFLNTGSVTYNGLTTKELISEKDSADLLTSTGIWIVDTTGGNDPENNKKRVVPVIRTSSVNSSNVVETSEEVSVDSEDNASTSTVDLSGILGWLYKIWKAITDIPDFITEFEASLGVSTIPPLLRKLVEWTQNLPETFTDHWTDFKAKMLEIPDILREIREFIKNIPETLTNIWEWVKTVPQILVDALEYIFVPSAGYMDTKVGSLRTSFPLFDSIIGSAEQLRSLFNFATTPPIIYIDLGASTSWNMGGRTVFIDMSWYAEYKPTMDLVISVFLWLLFLWRIFLALPGIISGTSGFWGSGSVESPLTSGSTDISIIR